jgi:hypothetical protein
MTEENLRHMWRMQKEQFKLSIPFMLGLVLGGVVLFALMVSGLPSETQNKLGLWFFAPMYLGGTLGALVGYLVWGRKSPVAGHLWTVTLLL